MKERSRKRIALRYSTSMLLFLTACICGYFGGYRSGYRAGDSAFQYHSIYAQCYNVSDLVEVLHGSHGPAPSRADYSAIMAVIRHAGIGEPESDFEAVAFPLNMSVVVTANGAVHRRIQTALDSIHQNAAPSSLINSKYREFNEKYSSAASSGES